jgi:hypothetical protein
MSFIRLRFRAEHDDVVGAVEAARLPVRGPSGRIYVLHDDGQVTQHPTAAQASFALSARPGSELLVWLVAGSAVATVVVREETRLVCRFDLAGASDDERAAAAAAVDVLLDGLADVELDAVL